MKPRTRCTWTCRWPSVASSRQRIRRVAPTGVGSWCAQPLQSDVHHFAAALDQPVPEGKERRGPGTSFSSVRGGRGAVTLVSTTLAAVTAEVVPSVQSSDGQVHGRPDDPGACGLPICSASRGRRVRSCQPDSGKPQVGGRFRRDPAAASPAFPGGLTTIL